MDRFPYILMTLLFRSHPIRHSSNIISHQKRRNTSKKDKRWDNIRVNQEKKSSFLNQIATGSSIPKIPSSNRHPQIQPQARHQDTSFSRRDSGIGGAAATTTEPPKNKKTTTTTKIPTDTKERGIGQITRPSDEGLGKRRKERKKGGDGIDYPHGRFIHVLNFRGWRPAERSGAQNAADGASLRSEGKKRRRNIYEEEEGVTGIGFPFAGCLRGD